jgi:hypothetical protein
MKTYIIKNQKLAEEIRKAEMAEGYMIVISRLNDKMLAHSTFTQKLNRKDIPICLVHYNKLLADQMEATTMEQQEISIKKEKELPPRYRTEAKTT